MPRAYGSPRTVLAVRTGSDPTNCHKPAGLMKQKCDFSPTGAWLRRVWRENAPPPGRAGRSLARTQGASISIDMGATEDTARGRAARSGGTDVFAPSPPTRQAGASSLHRDGVESLGASAAASGERANPGAVRLVRRRAVRRLG